MPLCPCCRSLVTWHGSCRVCGTGPEQCVVRPHCQAVLDRGTDLDYDCERQAAHPGEHYAQSVGTWWVATAPGVKTDAL